MAPAKHTARWLKPAENAQRYCRNSTWPVHSRPHPHPHPPQHEKEKETTDQSSGARESPRRHPTPYYARKTRPRARDHRAREMEIGHGSSSTAPCNMTTTTTTTRRASQHTAAVLPRLGTEWHNLQPRSGARIAETKRCGEQFAQRRGVSSHGGGSWSTLGHDDGRCP